ncbi:diadenylate cyclase CdaA [Streptococcus fryi]
MVYFMLFDPDLWSSLLSSPVGIVINLIDILLVTWLIYRFIHALAGTKIMLLVQGAVFFLVVRFVAGIIGLTTITYLMNQVVTYGVIAAVVIFAPEIRSGLEKFGRTPQSLLQTQRISGEEQLVTALVKSVRYMSPRKIGALISIERTQTLQEYISTGISLDADVSSQLLINIFIPNTPLHDGAVIISGHKIASASSYLPLSESTTIAKEFGTRHRAAIGLSEKTDAVTVVVSEETGGISLVYKERFIHGLTIEDFEARLRDIFISEEVKQGLLSKWLGGRR